MSAAGGISEKEGRQIMENQILLVIWGVSLG